MKSTVGVLLVVSLLLLYLNGLCTAADEGDALLAFAINLVDKKNLRDYSEPQMIWNRNDTNNYCEWSGVTCNNENSVIELNLRNRGVSGTLGNNGLANLTSLQRLDLYMNNITGNIPEEIGSLPELEYLDLSENSLNGTLPSTLSNLKKLIYIFLNKNSITGTLPSTLSDLTTLNTIDLSDNFITGNIPENLGNGHLKNLYLSNNNLNGALPNTLNMNMSNDGSIDLSHNSLSGSVPVTWVEYIIPAMYIVDLTFNNLTGKCTDAACRNEE